MSEAEELALIRAAQRGDMDAANRIIKHHAPFAQKVAYYYAQRHAANGVAEYQDYLQAALDGLWQGLRLYKPKKGATYLGYATNWIRQRCIQQLRDLNGPVRYPDKCFFVLREAKKKTKDVCGPSALADAIETIEAAEFHREAAKSAALRDHQLDFPWEASSSDGRSFLPHDKKLPSELQVQSTAEEDFDEARLTENLRDFVSLLTPREQWVVASYYGFHTTEKTLEAIGERLGLSRERIRQIRDRAICKLRRIYPELKQGERPAWAQ